MLTLKTIFTLFQIFGHKDFVKKQISGFMLSRYLFLDKGQVAEHLKQSKDNFFSMNKFLLIFIKIISVYVELLICKVTRKYQTL